MAGRAGGLLVARVREIQLAGRRRLCARDLECDLARERAVQFRAGVAGGTALRVLLRVVTAGAIGGGLDLDDTVADIACVTRQARYRLVRRVLERRCDLRALCQNEFYDEQGDEPGIDDAHRRYLGFDMLDREANPAVELVGGMAGRAFLAARFPAMRLMTARAVLHDTRREPAVHGRDGVDSLVTAACNAAADRFPGCFLIVWIVARAANAAMRLVHRQIVRHAAAHGMAAEAVTAAGRELLLERIAAHLNGDRLAEVVA